MKMEDMRGDIGRVGRMNGNTILPPDRHEERKELYQNLGSFAMKVRDMLYTKRYITYAEQKQQRIDRNKKEDKKDIIYTRKKVTQILKDIGLEEEQLEKLMTCIEQEEQEEENGKMKTKKGKKKVVNLSMIMKVRRLLVDMIISVRDKNETQLVVE